MSESPDKDNQQSWLWRQYLAKVRPESQKLPALDPNVLAAYLDGTAKPTDVAGVEARPVSDPGLLEELIELRGLRDLKPVAVSASVMNRAKAVPATKLAADTGRRLAQPSTYTWWRYLQWAAVAAAVLLSALAGHSVGGATFRGQHRAQSVVSSRASLEMEEFISEPTLGIIVPVNGNNGS